MHNCMWLDSVFIILERPLKCKCILAQKKKLNFLMGIMSNGNSLASIDVVCNFCDIRLENNIGCKNLY